MKIKNKTNAAVGIRFKGHLYIFNPHEEKKINGSFDEIKFRDENIKVDGTATKIKDCFEEVKEKKEEDQQESFVEKIEKKKPKKIKYKSEDKK